MKFGRIPCDMVGFSVSKKVGIAVDRNLIKRRLRAICREFFRLSNSSLGAYCRDLVNFGRSQTASLVSRPKFTKNSTTSTANTRIVDSSKSDSSDSKRGSIFDEQSGLCSCERGNRTDSSLTKRTTNLPDLSQKDKRANLICIFIAKSQILQTPFATLKDSIFATLKKQMRFMQNAPTNPPKNPRSFGANHHINQSRTRTANGTKAHYER